MMNPRSQTTALMALWECGVSDCSASRGEALLRAAGAEPAGTLGELNARLLELHQSLFGAEIDLLSTCPGCGTVSQFSCDCEALVPQRAQTDPSASHWLDTDGYRVEFRLPTAGDVGAASARSTPETFPHHLLDRCVLTSTWGDAAVAVHELPAPVLDMVSSRMEQLDPGASLSFALRCPECEARWDAILDVAQLTWQTIQTAAEKLLVEVDALARTYGWTEAEVLSLSPIRRAAYLQMAAG